jgi:glycosyltransferase involved in cell wall biosynthesis
VKIGINAPGYLREGLDNYIFHLVRSLAKVDQKNRYVLYCESQPFSELLPFLGKNWAVKALKPRKIWIQFGIPISCAFDRPDVFLFYTPFVPLLYRLYRPSKVVVVVHDIAFQHLKLYSPLRLKFMSIMIGFAVSIADKIIAVSQATKDDIVKFYNVDPSNIEVVHSGYDEDYAKDVAGDKITFVKRKYSIESRYILFVGTIKERKNVKRLIEAYHLLRREFKVNHKLVIGGRKNGNHYKEIVSRLAALKARE